MVLLEIVSRPPVRVLHEKLAQYPDGDTCHFRVRSVGSAHTFRLNVRVPSLHKQRYSYPWMTVVLEADEGGNYPLLKGDIRADGRRTGSLEALCSPQDTRLSWCGLDPRTVRLLNAQDIHDIGDLKLYTELGLCAKLLPPGTDSLTDQVVEEAVARYRRLRERLRQLRFYNPCDNDSEREPDAAEISAALISG